MIRYFIMIILICAMLASAWYGIPKHLELIEADAAFNECLQDLSYQECHAGIYGVQD